MAPIVELDHVWKHFGGPPVLQDVSLRIETGEIHSLIGENGSGKSTIVKILSGYHDVAAGRMLVRGQEVRLPLLESFELGIAVIHQDLGLVDTVTVTENLGVGLRFGAQRFRPISWRRERAKCAELLARFNVEISVSALVGELHPSERAMVGILRAVRELESREGNADKLLVLDEPTTYLGTRDVDRLIRFIRALRDDGAAIVFISHRLGEVLEISDRITVIRDGRIVREARPSDVNDFALVEAMLGYSITDFYPEKPAEPTGDDVLQVTDVAGGSLSGITFSVRSGEVLGVTGLAGSGHDELPYLISGARPRAAGAVWVVDHGVLKANVQSGRAGRLAVVPGNRHRDGLWLKATAGENLTLPDLRSFRRGGILDHGAERQVAATVMSKFMVKPPIADRRAGTFSGGNQQKIVLGKWLRLDPRVLLLHEPTQGVDAGARREVLNMVAESAESGTGVVLFSADYEQLANTCHRVLVMSQGRIIRELREPLLSEEEIFKACHQAYTVSAATAGGK
jgi:ribose transport system ATP-binding protein